MPRKKRALKRKKLRFGKGFYVVLGNTRSQAAQRVLEPGDAEGNAHNRHRGADRGLLKTLNFYVPPAYRRDGHELPAGKPAEKGR